MRFGEAPAGRRGYDAVQVDEFCERIAAALAGAALVTAAEIRGHEFAAAGFGQRGYDRDQVDEFLDEVCVRLELARIGAERRPAGASLSTPEDIRRLRFSAPPPDRAGYAAEEVRGFLDRVVATLAHLGPNGLSPDDIRTVDFTPVPAGSAAYHMDEVDAFVDLVACKMEAQDDNREPTTRTH